MKTQNKVQGRLGYNADNDRYGLLVSDLWENSGFHCGECIEVLVGNRWVATRMEIEMGVCEEKSVNTNLL